jgi:hypothetical protein
MYAGFSLGAACSPSASCPAPRALLQHSWETPSPRNARGQASWPKLHLTPGERGGEEEGECVLVPRLSVSDGCRVKRRLSEASGAPHMGRDACTLEVLHGVAFAVWSVNRVTPAIGCGLAPTIDVAAGSACRHPDPTMDIIDGMPAPCADP